MVTSGWDSAPRSWWAISPPARGRESTGTSQLVPIALVAGLGVKLNGAWLIVPSSTVTTGCPPWRIQVSMVCATGSPETASSAFHRSAVTVLA